MTRIQYSTSPQSSIVDICIFKHKEPFEINVKEICSFAIDEDKSQLEIIEMMSYMYGLYEDILAHSQIGVEKMYCREMMEEFDFAIDFIESPRYNIYVYQLAGEPLPIETAVSYNGVTEQIQLSPIVSAFAGNYEETDSIVMDDDDYTVESLDDEVATIPDDDVDMDLRVDNENAGYVTPPRSPGLYIRESPALPIRPGFMLDSGDDMDTNESTFRYEYEIDHFNPIEFNWISASPRNDQTDTPETIPVYPLIPDNFDCVSFNQI